MADQATVARVVGDQLLTEQQFTQHAALLRDLASPRASMESVSVGGQIVTRSAVTALDDSIGTTDGWVPTPFTPGGPLTIKILHVYTGKYPKNEWFGSKGVAVFSSVKDEYTFKGSSRAINYLAKGIGKKKHYTLPAYQDGTDIVAYIPGLASSAVTVTLQMAFDNFPDELFDKVAGAVGDLSQVPILAPKAGFLMLASKLINLGSDLLNGADSQAELEHTAPLNFDPINGPVTKADIRVIYKFPIDLTKYQFDWNNGLVLKTDKTKQYDEDSPYFIVLIDGAKRDGLKSFAPTVATADVLRSFLDVKPNSGTALIDAVVNLVKLDNDYTYYKQAVQIRDVDLKDPALSDDEKAKLKQKYNALIKNIGTTDPNSPFKLPPLA